MGYSAPFFNVAGSVRIAAPADVFAASWADYDNDGDLDAFLTGHFGQGCALMQDSGGNALHYLKVQLTGIRSNRAGIGARVQLYRNDTVQTQEVSGGSGQYGHNPSILHFGLGSAGYFDSLKVFWPSGAVNTLGRTNGDTTITIQENPVSLPEKIETGRLPAMIYSSRYGWGNCLNLGILDQLKIYRSNGTSAITIKPVSAPTEINLTALSSGVYFCQIKTKDHKIGVIKLLMINR